MKKLVKNIFCFLFPNKRITLKMVHGLYRGIKLNVAIKIKTKCKPEEIIIFLYTHYLSLYGSEIKATLVNPEPDNIPIISKTLP